MTNASVEKKRKKKHQRHKSYTEVNNNKKNEIRVFTKTILTYGKDVMSSRTPSTEVLLRWNYVRQAVGRALYTLEQFTISEAKIFRYITNTCR